MREGWSGKEAAVVLGVAPTKVTQAMAPAFRKVALLMMADSYRTQVELLLAMMEIRRERDQREIDLQVLMHRGRIDRPQVHPPRTAAGPQARQSTA